MEADVTGMLLVALATEWESTAWAAGDESFSLRPAAVEAQGTKAGEPTGSGHFGHQVKCRAAEL